MVDFCLWKMYKLNKILSTYRCDPHLKAKETVLINRDILDERDAFYLSDKIVIPLTKLRCKDYYNLFQENTTAEPTSVKRWS